MQEVQAHLPEGAVAIRILGKWIGFGVGPSTDAQGNVVSGADDDPRISKFKDDLTRKFSYAKTANLGSSTVFTQALVTVVMTAQRNWGFPVTGIIDAKFQYKMKWATPPPPSTRRPRGTLYTCQGTQPSDMWWGPPAEAAKMMEDLYFFQPVSGPYGAFPMNNSINEEKAELRRLIEQRGQLYPSDPINAAGYSQGAIVISEVYEEMRSPSDPLHYRFKDWKRAVTWGNPCRELGVEHGNRFAGLPSLGAKSRGIMEESRRMSDTPSWWYDFAHRKDIYCDTPNNDQGEDYTAICKIVMGNWFGGPDSILSQMIELGMNPFGEGMAMLQAIIGAGMFFGGGTKPHVTYTIDAAVRYLRS